MFKGQAVATAGTMVIAAVFILVGVMVYAYTLEATPHDTAYINESICNGTCTNGTNYDFDYQPILNDTTLTCYANGTITMTNGIQNGICLGFDIVDSRGALNITNMSSTCEYQNVSCDYTYDWATADQQTFWTQASNTSFGGFVLISVAAIVLAAVAVVSYVLLLRG